MKGAEYVSAVLLLVRDELKRSGWADRPMRAGELLREDGSLVADTHYASGRGRVWVHRPGQVDGAHRWEVAPSDLPVLTVAGDIVAEIGALE